MNSSTERIILAVGILFSILMALLFIFLIDVKSCFLLTIIIPQLISYYQIKKSPEEDIKITVVLFSQFIIVILMVDITLLLNG